jgi:hypothetical protein
VYANVPDKLVVAFNSVAESVVPYVIAAGAAQMMTGTAGLTTKLTDFVAVV